MLHHQCTKAERLARELRTELQRLRAHALHPHQVDADIFEVDLIVDHLADHSLDLEFLDRRAVKS